jgi:uncharacterized SAM-binding protein YcdF (DUF218 family)
MPTRLGNRAVMVAAAVVACGALGAALPSWLAVSDPLPARADAIFVFAGEAPERQRCAAELYRTGVAPRLVFSGGVVRGELLALGQPLTEAEVGARVAQSAGVPRDAMTVLPEGTSTWEDGLVLRRWVRDSGAREVVAVTSPLHSRRARRTLRLLLEPLGVNVHVLACGPRLAPTSGWWLDERPLIAVSNEALKMLLYGARHFAPAALGAAPSDRKLSDSP